MDAIAHTILALACIAGAYYGGRWLQVREARRMWGSIATPEVKREIELMNAIIQQMSREDRQYAESFSTEDFSTAVSTETVSTPLQLELFQEYGAYGPSPSE